MEREGRITHRAFCVRRRAAELLRRRRDSLDGDARWPVLNHHDWRGRHARTIAGEGVRAAHRFGPQARRYLNVTVTGGEPPHGIIISSARSMNVLPSECKTNISGRFLLLVTRTNDQGTEWASPGSRSYSLPR